MTVHILDSRWLLPEERTVDRTMLEEQIVTVIAPQAQNSGGKPHRNFSFQTAAMSPSDLASLSNAVTPVLAADSQVSGNLTEKFVLGQSGAAKSGQGEGIGSGDRNGFFGLKAGGKRVVFVVDCSRSMNHPHPSEYGTRFKRVKVELVRSITGMSRDMQFFIIFFNQNAITMPASSLQPAAPSTQRKYLYWMQSIKADGDTDPIDALRLALRLRPDVIYFLTDGSFRRHITVQLLNLDQDRTTIHTFAFQLDTSSKMQQAIELLKADQSRKAGALLNSRELRRAREMVSGEVTLKGIAFRNGGEYRLIP